jgi:hypothetical protein
MRTLLIALIFLAVAITGRSQVVVSGAANVFSNSTTATPVGSPFSLAVPPHVYSIMHGGLLTTTNFGAYRQIGVVDAVTGVTNWTTVQSWLATSTNSATETPALTNYTFTVYERLQLVTTNTFNIPTSVGAATLVTNTIIY